MHVQSCCFANLTYCLFAVLLVIAIMSLAHLCDHHSSSLSIST